MLNTLRKIQQHHLYLIITKTLLLLLINSAEFFKNFSISMQDTKAITLRPQFLWYTDVILKEKRTNRRIDKQLLCKIYYQALEWSKCEYHQNELASCDSKQLFCFVNKLTGSQLDTFCPQAVVYCYLEFKLRCLKNLKLFSIRVRELFDPIVSRTKGDGLLLFL